MEDDLWSGDLEFVAFAAHLLDEDGEVELASSGDLEAHAFAEWLDLEGDVGHDFAGESLGEVPGGDEGALTAREGRVVGDEVHGDGGRVDLGGGERDGVFGVGIGAADGDVVHAGDGDDVAADGVVAGDLLVDLEAEDLGDAGGLHGAVAHDDGDFLVDVELSAGDFADAEASEIG